MAGALSPGSFYFIHLGSSDHYNSWLYSGIAMNCGVHVCPRKCHGKRDHQDLLCTVKVRTELSCGHPFNRSCHISKGLLEACAVCKIAQRKAAREEEARIAGRPSVSVGPRPPASTLPWRDLRTSTTEDNRILRPSRSMNPSTNVFDTYCGPRRSTDTYKDGLFSKPRPQYDSFFSSGRGFGGGSWRR